MKRWLALAGLVVAISAAAAWITQSISAGGDTSGTLPFPSKPIGEREMAGPPPTVVLDGETVFNFGIMSQQDVGTRDFVIGNEGPGDLILTGTQPSCSCTVGNLNPGESVTVKPGGQFTISIRWETRDFTGRYEKYAIIETNDPQRPQLLFTAKGEVQPDLITLPEGTSIDFRRVTNDKPQRHSMIVASPSRPEMELTSLSTSRPDLIHLSHRPLDKDELAKLKLTGAHEVMIEVQPSKELGPFLEEVVIQTDHPKRSELRLSVSGTISGPISITPPMIRMRDVIGSRGDSTSALVWVRGQSETAFEVVRKPEALSVEIVPAEETGDAKGASAAGRAYRLTVSVRPGASPGVVQTPIVLKTDHPEAGELAIPVEVRILGDG